MGAQACHDEVNIISAASSSRTGFALLIAALALCICSACVSSKYKRADSRTLPIQPLDVKFPPSVLDASLYAEISFGAPGSWKRQAFWDEYVVTLRNKSDRSIYISTATLSDYAGEVREAGSDPWKLERESKSLEKRYRDAGVSFARMAAPRVLASTAEPTIVGGVGIGASGAAAAAAVTAVALPIYGATVLGINLHNKSAIKKEFDRRRLSLPFTLSAGESRTGSFFFAMVPNPQALTLEYLIGADRENTSLDLHFLEGLHMTSPTP